MPRTSAPADRFDILTGLFNRTCTVCSTELTLTAENFFHRTDRDGNVTWVDRRCQTCRRQRDAETRAARRAGSPVRATRTGRKFGVEIECIVNASDLLRELTARGVAATIPGYTHRVMSNWKIVTDASVPGGYELVSPPLSGADGIDQLRRACEALDAAGARVNRSCGLHVHHDVSDLDAATFGRLLRNWAASQLGIDGLVAPSRRNSQWARPLDASEIRSFGRCTDLDGIRNQASYINRYRSLNVASFPRYGTVEVRQHQGTTSFDKIAGWIAFGQAIVAQAKAGVDAVPTTTDDLLDGLAAHGLAAAQVTFLKGRAAHFSGRRAPVAA